MGLGLEWTTLLAFSFSLPCPHPQFFSSPVVGAVYMCVGGFVELAQLSMRETLWRSKVKVTEACYLLWESCTVFMKIFAISQFIKTPKHLSMMVLAHVLS